VLPYFLADPEPRVPTPVGSPHPRPYFLFVGRLEKIKGLDDVIPLFKRGSGADLLVAGEGTHEAELRRLAQGTDRIRFVGGMSSAALRAYYQHALAVIVPSVCFETFGIVLIEAFQNHAPVIARRLGPFPEIIETSNGGELFENPEELAAAIHRIQSDPAYRTRLAEAGHRAYVERYCESAVLPRFLDIVRSVALRAGRAQLAETLSTVGQSARN
jgi:glycosyltransferase involved in cell wall biosynthesis